MAVKTRKASTKNRTLKVVIYGDYKTGKTRIGLSFPSVLGIDAEGSIDWYADESVDWSQGGKAPALRPFEIATDGNGSLIKTWKGTREVVDAIQRGQIKCGTLMIDSLTAIYNSLKDAATEARPDKQLRPLDWGILKQQNNKMMTDLYEKLPCHVVVTAWLKDEYAKEGAQVAGRIVSANELVKVGEIIDADKKAGHAFDLILKTLPPKQVDGKTVYAVQVIGGRGALTLKYPPGSIIQNFSYDAHLKPFFEAIDSGAVAPEVEATPGERKLDDARIFERPPSRQELETLFLEWRDKAKAEIGFGPWIVKNIPSAADLPKRVPRELSDAERLEIRDKLQILIAELAPADEQDFTFEEAPASAAPVAAEQPAAQRPDETAQQLESALMAPITDKQRIALMAMFRESGVTSEAARHAYANDVCGKPSSKQWNQRDFNLLRDALKQGPQQGALVEA